MLMCWPAWKPALAVAEQCNLTADCIDLLFYHAKVERALEHYDQAVADLLLALDLARDQVAGGRRQR